MLSRLLKQSNNFRRLFGNKLTPIRGNVTNQILFFPNRIFHKARHIRFNFSSLQQITENQFIQQYEINNSNSETMFNQITTEISQVEDLNQAFQMAQKSSDLFLQRNEVEKSISILQTFKKQFAKQECIQSLIVAAYLTEFYFLIGNLMESRKQAADLYNMYQFLRPNLLDSEILSCTNLFQSTMAHSDQIQFAINYLEIAKNLIEKQQTIEAPQQQITDIYNLLGYYYYQSSQYQDALNSFNKFKEIINENLDNKVKFNLLTAFYMCNQKLHQYQKCKHILSEIRKNYGDFKEESLNKHFSFQFSQINQYQNGEMEDVIKQVNREMIKEQQDRTIINIDQNDQIAQEFLIKQKYQEGIKLYEDLLSKLDPSKDYIRIAKVSIKLIPFYQKLEQYDRILQILLSSFNMYLNKRRQLMLDDLETYLMLINLKDNYFFKKDFKKSYEWGRKWYSFLNINNLLKTFNNNVLMSMYLQLFSYKTLKMHEDALDFAEIIEKYIQKSPDYDEIKLQLWNEKAEILLELKNLTESIECYQQVVEHLLSQKDLSSKKQEQLFNSIKAISFLCIETGDLKGLLKYGQLYLEKRKDYEIEDDYIYYRLVISYQISLMLMGKRQYHESEQFIRQSLDLAHRINTVDFQFELQLMLAELSFFQEKIEDGEKYLQIADDISLKSFSQTPNYQTFLEQVLKVRSFEFYYKKEYNTCLKYIEVSFQKDHKDRRTQIQEQILQDLYKSNQELQDSIKKLGIIDV